MEVPTVANDDGCTLGGVMAMVKVEEVYTHTLMVLEEIVNSYTGLQGSLMDLPNLCLG
jgi:hypothetical protein